MIDDLRLPPQRQPPENTIQDLQGRLQSSMQTNGRPLAVDSFERLVAAGMTDFSSAHLETGIAINLSPPEGSAFNFQNTRFQKLYFAECNFRNADFRGADMTFVRFSGCEMSGADFSSVVIRNQSFDLRAEEITLPAAAPFVHIDSPGIIKGCTFAEPRYVEIFEGQKQRGEGIILTYRGSVLGVQKLFLEHSFLGTQTTRNPDGTVAFWKGGLYALEKDFAQFLMVSVEMKRSRGSSREWPAVDLEEALTIFRATREPDHLIGATLLRFLRDPLLIKKLPAWQKILESSTNMISLKDAK